MSRHDAVKEAAWKANLAIAKHGLALFTWGNASEFDPASGVFAIKPSGVPYDELRPSDMVVVDLDGKVVEGTLRPSSDTPTHRWLYRAWKDLRGVAHSHSTYATAWAQTMKPIPLYGTTHADHMPEEIPCAPPLSAKAVEGHYEEETGRQIVDHLAGRDPLRCPMLLVGGHAPFTWGKSAEDAVHHAVVLEEIARMAILTRMANGGSEGLGLPPHLVKKHYERKHGANAYYGQR